MLDSPTAAGDAPVELARILDHAPPVAEGVLRGDTRLTRRWGHGALHDNLAPLKGHVIITYYGQPQEIIWRVQGDRLGGTTKTGSVTIIPGGHEGRWDIAGPIEVSHVFLTEERLQSSADLLAGGKRVELLDRVGFEDPVSARVMEMLCREAESGDPTSRLFVEQAIDLLCTQLIRGHSSFGSLTVEHPRGGLANWQVKKVAAYMRDHIEEDIGLDELAALVGLSRFHFCTAFRRATGRTPHEWLVGQRMERARQLLADPGLRVTEIALAVGYETPSSFAASFRKVVGVTPTEFRRAL